MPPQIHNMYLGNADLFTHNGLAQCSPTNIFDIVYWCNDYRRRNRFPVNVLKRFGIGLYQINQGMEWKDGGLNKYESFAASVCHFVMVAKELKLPIEDALEIKLSDFGKGEPIYCIAEQLLYHISRAQQHLFYADQGNRTKRSGRYDEKKLTESLTKIIKMLIQTIPSELRCDCFEKATEIMTRELK